MLLCRNGFVSEWRCVGMALCWNGVVPEWRCVRMALCRYGVESEWRCVGMALCQNGVMSCVVFVNGKMSGVKQSEDRPSTHIFSCHKGLTRDIYSPYPT